MAHDLMDVKGTTETWSLLHDHVEDTNALDAPGSP